ncbi:hypothetical protein T439DRAFT_321703 [Meredithblackwellia eburnea MCA 4105]
MMNGFIPPKLAVSPAFEFIPAYDELLEQIATTNVVDADWPILRDIIKYKLEQATKDFLTAGPPWLSGIGRTSFTPEDAYRALSRCYELLDNFQAPPFTIQRLCELTVGPRQHYTSLPKYFRALTRVISVTSDTSIFPEDESVDFARPPTASTSSAPVPALLSHAGVIQAGVTIPTRRPAAGRSPMSSPKAVPVVVPLLSPIPWLMVKDDDMERIDSMDLSNTSTSLHNPSTSSPSSSRLAVGSPPSAKRSSPIKTDVDIPLNSSSTSTPTGGLVDEVDPGSGTQDTAEPISLTTANFASQSKNEGELTEVSSLAERFVRASSPKVEKDMPDDESEGLPDLEVSRKRRKGAPEQDWDDEGQGEEKENGGKAVKAAKENGHNELQGEKPMHETGEVAKG